MSDIAFLSAVEIQKHIRRGELSPVDVVKACLNQIGQHPDINAVVTLSDTALDDAHRQEQYIQAGGEPGPLCGIIAGIKDVTPVAGLRFTYGSKLYKDNVASEDAVVVRRLREAGAIILGKTNTPEFATGGNTFNEVFGYTANPWNTKLSAGGSTGGGAAALAAGMITLAEGTDLGGSLRIPASFCGVVGLRPTPGLVPTFPSEDIYDDLQVTGGMARSAADLALFLQATAGPSCHSPIGVPVVGRDFSAALDKPLKGMRVAYCPDIAGIGIDEDIERVCCQTAFELKQAGATVEKITLDLSFSQKAFLDLRGHWMLAQQRRRLDKIDHFGENLANNIGAGLKVTPEDLDVARQTRDRACQKLQDLFEKFDYILTPSMAVPPFPVEQNYPEKIAGKPMKTYIDWVAPTFLLSLTSLPVGSVPCGLDSQGLPVGLQIVGPQQGEEAVLGLAHSIQEIAPIGRPALVKEDTAQKLLSPEHD